MVYTTMSKLDEYTIFAIGHEGARNWPTYWISKKDPIYQRYLVDKQRNKQVDAKKYIAQAQAYYAQNYFNSTRFKKSARRKRGQGTMSKRNRRKAKAKKIES